MQTRKNPKPRTPKEVVAPGALTEEGVFNELSRAVVQLLNREPFFGHLLANVPRSVDSTLTRTAAVGLRGSKPFLTVNPDFFMKTLKTTPERVAIVKHEVLHLLFKHLFRMSFKGMNPLIFNYAADIVVNQFIGHPWKLPDGAITLKTFPALNLEPNRDVRYYYDKLMANAEAAGSSASGWGEPGDPGAVGGHSDHTEWGKGQPGEEAVGDTEIDRIIEGTKNRSPKGYSQLPGELQRLIDTYLTARAPKVDWRRAMRMFATSSNRTKLKSTMMHPSRRYPGAPGLKVKKYSSIVAVVDTSGSVSNDLMSDFFAEIHAIHRAGATVYVVDADAAVHRVWEYKGRLPDKMAGRGGTDFNPALAWIAANKNKLHIDGAIYLTDGEAAMPTENPHVKLLWLIVGPERAHDLPFGRNIYINP